MAKVSIPIHNCPNCGSHNTGKVNGGNQYCSDCCIEFDSETGKMYTIEWDGTLVDFYENEFADIV